MDQTLHRVATMEKDEIWGRPSRGWQDDIAEGTIWDRKAMEDIDGGLHPAVDRQRLGEW